MGRVRRACVICAILFAPAMAWAMHPLGVEDSGTEGSGNYLLEMTGDYIKEKVTGARLTTLTSVIAVGASKHTDLALEVPYLKLNPSEKTDRDEKGVGDIRLKVKYQLFENEVKQSMAYQIYTDLPTGNYKRGLGTHNVVWGVTLIDTQECHDNAFHFNLGYEVLGRDVKKVHFVKNYAILFGIAAEHKFTESFRLVTELKGEHRKEVNSETEIIEEAEVTSDVASISKPFTFMTGMVYDITKGWYVDLGLRVGLNKYAEDYTALVGTAWRF